VPYRKSIHITDASNGGVFKQASHSQETTGTVANIAKVNFQEVTSMHEVPRNGRCCHNISPSQSDSARKAHFIVHV
jgi:hypothetical protein